MVRGIEWFTSPFINHFMLAEKAYSTELPFIGKRFTILENKALKPPSRLPQATQQKINLLFSGTLDRSTGVFHAIALAKKLNEQSGNVSLTIIGFASLEKVRDEIQASTKHLPFIEMIGIDQQVVHSQILNAINSATAGIIYYPPSAHTVNRIPTKLYEYLAAQLPILYDAKATWRSLPQHCGAGLAVDFESPNCPEIIFGLISNKFYPQAPEDVFWEAENLFQILE